VDAWNEKTHKAIEQMMNEAMDMTDGTMTIMPAVEEPKEELMEVELTDNYIQVWLNIDREAFVNEIQLALGKIDANITVTMRIAWMDASDKSIGPLEQTFLLNMMTPYTAEVQTNDCANAAATFKGKAHNQ
jgi:glutamine cyclotransferase